MFDDDIKKQVEVTRKVWDVATIAKDIMVMGAVQVSLQRADTFVKTVKEVTNTLDHINNLELKEVYVKFLHKLEKHIKDKDVNDLDSKELIKDFLRTDQRLFDGVEVILHCISTAAVTLSVESSVETLVSHYEKHFDKI